jgi:CRP/FNR family transcriptional regulator
MENSDLVKNLRRMSLFSDLTEEELTEIAGYLKEKPVQKRDLIFSEGDPPNFLYIVKEGKVKITKISQEGKELILEIISPYHVFGGVAVMRGFPYPANAVAMEDGKVLLISRKDLMRILDGFPQLMFSFAMDLGERVKGSHEMLKNIALEKVESRVASLLLKLMEKMGRETENGSMIDMRLTKQDIADMVGTTVETAIRTVSKLKKLGYIREESGRIYITDPEGLKDIAS